MRRCRGNVVCRWAAALLVAAVLALCGCGTQARAPGRAGLPARGSAVRLVDAQGVEVSVVGRPERIVSAAPTVTEILFALGAGDRIAAATDQCDYPPEAEGLPRIGGWFTPSAERTMAARPDLIIGSRGNPTDFITAMRKSACPVFTIDPKTLDDIYEAIGQIALIIGEAEAGEALVGRMRDRLGAVAARVRDVPEGERPTAFIMLQVSPLWTAGKGTFQDDAIRAAGARNLGAEKNGFAPYSTETLMAADPDFLLLSTMEGDPERMRREVLGDSALRRLSAARDNGIVVLEADPIMRPGPRIVDAVEAMARAFYGERLEAAGGPPGR
jgi:iron complex transport system substrate-binding protein